MFEADNPVYLAKKITVVLANSIIAQKIAFNTKKLSDKNVGCGNLCIKPKNI
jgi:hypothetical protein